MQKLVIKMTENLNSLLDEFEKVNADTIASYGLRKKKFVLLEACVRVIGIMDSLCLNWDAI